MKNKLKIFIIILFIITGIFSLWKYSNSTDTNTKKYSSLKDVTEDPIAIVSGSTYGQIAINNGHIEEGTTFSEYNSELDAIEALRRDKIGSVIDARVFADRFCLEFDDIMVFPIPVGNIEYAFGFQKDSPLKDEFDKTAEELREEGIIAKLEEKWTKSEKLETTIAQDWVGEKGTLEYWVNIGTEPLAFVGDNGQIVGLAIDYVYNVAKRMGYNVNVNECNFGGIIPALVSGSADIAGRSIAITEERKKQIDFSVPYLNSDIVLIVKKDNVNPELLENINNNNKQTSLIASINESLNNTFIKENRYKLFIDGIRVTLSITVLSIIFGSILGLLLFAIYWQNHITLNKIIDAIASCIQGTPTVVILMIMYYIVFKDSFLDGDGIAVFTFSILFSLSALDLLKAGVEAIGKGQIESATDLGFSNIQILTKILLPQIIIYIMPLYRSKVVEHLKSTSIVGYIAIADLTKTSDMIRSRTFEAFFPLIVTALLYYLLGKILNALLLLAEKKIKPGNHQSYLLRGVNIK